MEAQSFLGTDRRVLMSAAIQLWFLLSQPDLQPLSRMCVV